MQNVFSTIWGKCVEFYMIYSGFIHSIFKDQLGDLVEGIFDIVVACVIVKLVASAAFGSKNNG